MAKTQPPETSTLTAFGCLLVAQAKAKNDGRSGIPEHCYRRQELQKVATTLAEGNSLLIVRQPGAGARTLIRGLARAIAERQPEANALPPDTELLLTTVPHLIEDTGLAGSLEKRLLGLRRLVDRGQGRLILAIPDFENLIGAGAVQGNEQGDVARRLLSLMDERFKQPPRLTLIGTTTLAGIVYIEQKVPLLLSTFKQLKLEPMDNAMVCEVILDYIDQKRPEWRSLFKDNHSLVLDLLRLGKVIYPQVAAPGVATNLIDLVIVENLQEFSADHLHQALYRVVAQHSGLPMEIIDPKQPMTLPDLEAKIRETFIGQDRAVDKICNIIIRHRAGIADSRRPAGSLLFCGPTGVGKTELARVTAKVLFGSPERLIRIDLSDYEAGASRAFDVGQSLRDRLVAGVRHNPYSVILLDELDKTSPLVWHTLLQILDEAAITDHTGLTLQLTNNLIILTTVWNSDKVDAKLEPELLGRLDEIVPFEPLTPEECKKIVKTTLDRLPIERPRFISDKLALVYDDKTLADFAAEVIKQARIDKYNGREIRRIIEQSLVYPLAARLSSGELQPDTKIILTMRAGKPWFETTKSRSPNRGS